MNTSETETLVMGDAVPIFDPADYPAQVSACEGCHHDCGCDGDDVPPCPGDELRV